MNYPRALLLSALAVILCVPSITQAAPLRKKIEKNGQCPYICQSTVTYVNSKGSVETVCSYDPRFATENLQKAEHDHPPPGATRLTLNQQIHLECERKGCGLAHWIDIGGESRTANRCTEFEGSESENREQQGLPSPPLPEHLQPHPGGGQENQVGDLLKLPLSQQQQGLPNAFDEQQRPIGGFMTHQMQESNQPPEITPNQQQRNAWDLRSFSMEEFEPTTIEEYARYAESSSNIIGPLPSGKDASSMWPSGARGAIEESMQTVPYSGGPHPGGGSTGFNNPNPPSGYFNSYGQQRSQSLLGRFGSRIWNFLTTCQIFCE